MTLKSKITEDMKTAMRAKDAPRLAAIRLLLSAMKQKEVDERVELSDADVVTIIDKMLKQRRESIAQFEKGGRQDLADTEKFEVGVLQQDDVALRFLDASADRHALAAVLAGDDDAHVRGPERSDELGRPVG